MNGSGNPHAMDRRWRRIIFLAVVAVTGFFLAQTTIHHWHDFTHLRVDLKPALLVAAGGLLMLSLAFQGLGWLSILRALSPLERVPRLEGLSIQSIAGAGKYIPGSVAPLAAKYWLARRWGLRTGVISTSIVLESLYGLVGLAVVSLLAVAATRGGVVLLTLIILTISAAAILAWPRPWHHVRRLAAKVHSSLADLTIEPLPLRVHLGLASRYVFIAAVAGLGFAFLVQGLFPSTAPDFLTLMGVFSASSLVGFLTITAPAGLGAREAALVWLLTPAMATPEALTATLVARVWTLAGDAAFFGIGLIIRFRRHLTITTT